MLVWILILALILLILVCPVGIDGAYGGGESFLKLKIGLFRKTLLPRERKAKKPKKEKKKKPEPDSDETPKEKKKVSFTLDDILTLAEIALDTLHRFRVHLSVDRLAVHWVAAASDPYDAVLQYGRVNAALGALVTKTHTALKVRDEDVRTELDLEAAKPKIEGRLILTIQIWEVLLILLCAGFKGARWILNKKRTERAAAAAAKERSIQDGEF